MSVVTSWPWLAPHHNMADRRIPVVDSVLVDSDQEDIALADNDQEDSVLADRIREGTGYVHWGNESLEGRGGGAVAVGGAGAGIAVDCRLGADSWDHQGSDGHKSLQCPGKSDTENVDALPT